MKKIINKLAKNLYQRKKYNSNIYTICTNSSGELNSYCNKEITHTNK
jgi:hypothetical protein